MMVIVVDVTTSVVALESESIWRLKRMISGVVIMLSESTAARIRAGSLRSDECVRDWIGWRDFSWTFSGMFTTEKAVAWNLALTQWLDHNTNEWNCVSAQFTGPFYTYFIGYWLNFWCDVDKDIIFSRMNQPDGQLDQNATVNGLAFSRK